jgi:hypothetical protein
VQKYNSITDAIVTVRIYKVLKNYLSGSEISSGWVGTDAAVTETSSEISNAPTLCQDPARHFWFIPLMLTTILGKKYHLPYADKAQRG